ncbi:ferredoxin--NADP reductase [Conchiformibius kuhniae]|uniref:ferredoxin--NADP(+) reductase n=1 Tax=Conchiformibius kuhniae TaxID=211502 RepID=A0ABD8B7Q7_9NEIS|nr:ferredoxin--NADP reductase [Conchiformibius kuhniae]
MQQEKFTEQTVLWVKRHSPKHLTFAISRPESYRFAAGQFSRLGVREGAGFLWRAYSVISAEYADTLEYFVVLIDGGPMSAHLARLQAGDTLLLDKTAQGFFLPERFSDGAELVMLSTGSGIAPFLSILQQPEIWQRFDTLALAHSVSYHNELIFNDWIAALAEHPLVGDEYAKLRFLPVATRERDGTALHTRLPEAVANGQLAQAFGLDFDRERSRFMICGNPAMVRDTFQALLDAGFAMHRNRQPGHIMMENGF